MVLSNAHGVRALAEGACAGRAADGRARRGLARSPRSILREGASVTNPVDLTFGAEPTDYNGALRCVLADDAINLTLVIYASAVPRRLQDITDVIIAANADHPTKPVVASVLGVGDRGFRDDRGHSVPSSRFPRPRPRPLAVSPARGWKRRPEGIVPDVDGLGIDLGRAEALIAHALDVRPTGTLLPWSVAAELLDIFGIAVAPAVAVTTVEAAVATANQLGYPIALKATGMRRLGRSEAAGVALTSTPTTRCVARTGA